MVVAQKVTMAVITVKPAAHDLQVLRALVRHKPDVAEHGGQKNHHPRVDELGLRNWNQYDSSHHHASSNWQHQPQKQRHHQCHGYEQQNLTAHKIKYIAGAARQCRVQAQVTDGAAQAVQAEQKENHRPVNFLLKVFFADQPHQQQANQQKGSNPGRRNLMHTCRARTNQKEQKTSQGGFFRVADRSEQRQLALQPGFGQGQPGDCGVVAKTQTADQQMHQSHGQRRHSSSYKPEQALKLVLQLRGQHAKYRQV